jgi:Protein of unknown function (DUF1553)/Protein of unknown function (DUF1549)/Planctomycete cytochrome C
VSAAELIKYREENLTGGRRAAFRRRIFAISALLAGGISTAAAQADTELFEKKIRPLLASRCYQCHSDKVATSGLRLDYKGGWERGGSRGAAIVPGDPDASLLVRAVSQQDPKLKMPPGAALSETEISDLREWVRSGAPDPRTALPVAGKTSAAMDFAQARTFWAFQPIRKITPPRAKSGAGSSPIDAFILARLDSAALKPAPPTDKGTWLRRVTLDLIGLPPTREEIAAFLADKSPRAYETVVDRLLASPHYGERWARHWLDLVRFAETSGHEFDFEKQEAWRYRDYVIRAFNQDLPYDRFVKEQIAGDLMPTRRLTPDGTQQDTLIATALFGLGEERNGATDLQEVRDEKMDSRIDVFGKAFLGLTIACARCHDHKFDPISTADYYALGGIFESTQVLLSSIQSPAQNREAGSVHRRLVSVNDEIHKLVAGAQSMREFEPAPPKTLPKPSHPYYPLARLAATEPSFFAARLAEVRQELADAAAEAAAGQERNDILLDDFAGRSFAGWHTSGLAFAAGPVDGMANSYRGGSEKLMGTLMSKSFRPARRYIHVRLAGTKFTPVRERPSLLAVTIFANGRYPKGVAGDGDGILKWKTITLQEEIGQICNLEIADRRTDGHIIVDKIVFSDTREPPPDPPDARVVQMLANPAIGSMEDLLAAYRQLYRKAVEAPPDDIESQSLAASLAPGESIEQAAQRLGADGRQRLRELLSQKASLEAALPNEPFGMLAAEDEPRNLKIHIRGSHLNPGEEVPRRFLQVLAGDQAAPYANGSGRAALAEALFSADNPLTARVMVNRIWQHHFGEGLVRTVDNFGHTGETPSHPELLDYLATSFRESNWSVKAMHRAIVLSDAYRRSSAASGRAREIDPDNRLLSHMPVRRLDAEVIRDAILSASGSLDRTSYGPSVRPHISAYQEGRGKPESGPLDGAGRRSVYLEVRRNFITPLFLAFDYPLPTTTAGRRSTSTVPSQALMLMNNEFVAAEAAKWAERTLKRYTDFDARLEDMFLRAYGRPPDAADRTQIAEFLGRQSTRYAENGEQQAWSDVAHVIFNSKEFIFVK